MEKDMFKMFVIIFLYHLTICSCNKVKRMRVNRNFSPMKFCLLMWRKLRCSGILLNCLRSTCKTLSQKSKLKESWTLILVIRFCSAKNLTIFDGILKCFIISSSKPNILKLFANSDLNIGLFIRPARRPASCADLRVSESSRGIMLVYVNL